MRTALQQGCCCGLCSKCRDWHRQIMPLNPVGAAMRPGAAITSNKYYFKGRLGVSYFVLFMYTFDLYCNKLIASAVIGVY
jgi:hypothetical protein